jgi:hypothetical protein
VALPPIDGKAPLPAASPRPAEAARAAAQRAFFNTALAKAGAPAAPTAPNAPVAAAPARADSRAVQPAVTRLRDETTVPPHPGRILRPGSLIDIKV